MTGPSVSGLPRWVLAVAPVLALLAVLGSTYLIVPFVDLAAVDGADTLEILWMVTIIGTIAGVVPVAIGMLWFPYIRDLDPRHLHAFLALTCGVLAFIAVALVGDVYAYTAAAENGTVAALAAIVGAGGTVVVMFAANRWRTRELAAADRSGLEVAYLVAVALGLHSIGEGLGIGVAYARGDATLVSLLVLAFVLHNVMEGPTVVAAVARDRTAPPLGHFVAMGLLAGGPVVVGGWIGSFAQSNLLAVTFFAIAVGAIAQVLVEIGQLIRVDAEVVCTRTNAATFAVGFALTFLLEDVVGALVLEGWPLPA